LNVFILTLGLDRLSFPHFVLSDHFFAADALLLVTNAFPRAFTCCFLRWSAQVQLRLTKQQLMPLVNVLHSLDGNQRILLLERYLRLFQDVVEVVN
jgi:hypothetical protein